MLCACHPRHAKSKMSVKYLVTPWTAQLTKSGQKAVTHSKKRLLAITNQGCTCRRNGTASYKSFFLRVELATNDIIAINNLSKFCEVAAKKKYFTSTRDQQGNRGVFRYHTDATSRRVLVSNVLLSRLESADVTIRNSTCYSDHLL